MTLAECSFGAFTILNIVRLVAYVPQLMRVHRDINGAESVSLATWSLFAAANLATVGYALTAAHDVPLAITFSLNALGCLAIVGLTVWKRLGKTALRSIYEAGR